MPENTVRVKRSNRGAGSSPAPSSGSVDGSVDVSVVLTVGQSEDHIGRFALRVASRLAALGRRFELVAVNAGCADNSFGVLRLIESQLPPGGHLKILSAPNRRPLLTGALAAQGSALAFVTPALMGQSAGFASKFLSGFPTVKTRPPLNRLASIAEPLKGPRKGLSGGWAEPGLLALGWALRRVGRTGRGEAVIAPNLLVARRQLLLPVLARYADELPALKKRLLRGNFGLLVEEVGRSSERQLSRLGAGRLWGAVDQAVEKLFGPVGVR